MKHLQICLCPFCSIFYWLCCGILCFLACAALAEKNAKQSWLFEEFLHFVLHLKKGTVADMDQTMMLPCHRDCPVIIYWKDEALPCLLVSLSPTPAQTQLNAI